MTMLDIAQAMRGKLRDGYSAPQAGGAAMTSEMAYGTARADSVGGFVEIVMDNMPSGADPDDYAFTVACDAPISKDGRVALVTINGTSKAVSTATVAQIAQSASATATATNQYFFHDANGAHVATVAGDPDSGRNVTLNSYGLLFRDGATDLAEFTPTEIKLGENCTLADLDDQVGTVSVDLMHLATLNLLMKHIDITGYSSFHRVPQLEISLDGSSYGQTGYVTVRNLLGDNAVVSFERNGAICEGLPAIGVFKQTLYSSSTGVGANDTILLDDSAARYNVLEFVFTDGTRNYAARLNSPDGSSTSLSRSVVSGSTIYHAALMVSVSGTTVTLGAGAQSTMSGNAISTTTSSPPLKVIEVNGYI